MSRTVDQKITFLAQPTKWLEYKEQTTPLTNFNRHIEIARILEPAKKRHDLLNNTLLTLMTPANLYLSLQATIEFSKYQLTLSDHDPIKALPGLIAFIILAGALHVPISLISNAAGNLWQDHYARNHGQALARAIGEE